MSEVFGARVTTPLAIGFLWWEFVAATGDLFVYIYLVRQRGLAFEPSSHPAPAVPARRDARRAAFSASVPQPSTMRLMLQTRRVT